MQLNGKKNGIIKQLEPAIRFILIPFKQTQNEPDGLMQRAVNSVQALKGSVQSMKACPKSDEDPMANRTPKK